MAVGKKALIAFVDIRGFTVWSEKVENADILDDFIKGWYGILGGNFPPPNRIKHLGDGAMIIREMPEKTTADLLKTILAETLESIARAGQAFGEFCKRLSEEEGTKIDLLLGWGLAKGPVKKIGAGGTADYVGSNINKCSRYCDIARPFGIVIDAYDFQVLPEPFSADFSMQTRFLKGIDGDCPVWVTKDILERFMPREEIRENPEVHVAGVCFRKDRGEFFVLLGLRSKHRRLFPSLYEGCGGQLAHNELFHEGVMRHYEKEFHVKVKVHRETFFLYEIDTNSAPKIPGIRFLCEYESGDPRSENHDPPTPKWFSEHEFSALPEDRFIPGLKGEIARFLDEYKSISGTARQG